MGGFSKPSASADALRIARTASEVSGCSLKIAYRTSQSRYSGLATIENLVVIRPAPLGLPFFFAISKDAVKVIE